MTDLTDKQESFVHEYISNGGNASDAYRKSYNTENCSSITINEEGYRLTINPDIALRIVELQTIIRENSTEKFLWTIEEKKKKAQEIVDDGMVTGTKGMQDRSSAIKGLDYLSKIDGDFAPEKHEIKESPDEWADNIKR